MISIAILAVTLSVGADPGRDAPELPVSAVLLRPAEEAELAAREAGAITSIETTRGRTVKEDQLLVQIDDAEAQLAGERVQIELEIAHEKADNDVGIRHAGATLEVARAELAQAEDAVKDFPQSISGREMARLRLAVKRDELAVEQAEHEHRIAQAEWRARQNEGKLAALRLARCKVTAPFAGIVAEITRARGEWVEPGDPVVRLLRIDRLRAEGFVDARYANLDLVGNSIQLSVRHPNGTSESIEGELVFVSPEIDPVNGQILVWAEVGNPDLKLRPGIKAEMAIRVASDPATR